MSHLDDAVANSLRSTRARTRSATSLQLIEMRVNFGSEMASTPFRSALGVSRFSLSLEQEMVKPSTLMSLKLDDNDLRVWKMRNRGHS